MKLVFVASLLRLEHTALTYQGIRAKTGGLGINDKNKIAAIKWKKTLISDGQQFHQYQQNVNNRLSSQIIEHRKDLSL